MCNFRPIIPILKKTSEVYEICQINKDQNRNELSNALFEKQIR